MYMVVKHSSPETTPTERLIDLSVLMDWFF
jgi:hypothetical protein